MNALLLVVVAQQEGRPTHPGKRVAPPVSISDKPVTAREVRESFLKASALMTKVHGQPLGTPLIPAADRAATRAEIVAEMARIYKAAQPTLRFTPATTRHDASKFKIEAGQKSSLERLVTLGCVGRVAPLAVGPTSGLTPKQFGDALGFFMARLTQMSHLPSQKWTPMLQGG